MGFLAAVPPTATGNCFANPVDSFYNTFAIRPCAGSLAGSKSHAALEEHDWPPVSHHVVLQRRATVNLPAAVGPSGLPCTCGFTRQPAVTPLTCASPLVVSCCFLRGL